MSTFITGKSPVTGSHDEVFVTGNGFHVNQYVWDTNTLNWIKQASSGGGTGTEVTVTNASIPVTQSGVWSVGVNNFPATQAVTQSGSWNIAVSNFPVTQSVSWSGQSVSVTGSVAVTGPLTDTQLRATPVPVSGPLTDSQLRATAVPVSGPLTDAQLRATAVPVSGPLTDTQLRATAVPVSGPLTDAQLRATAVVVASQGNATSSVTSVAASATSVTLKASNASRKGLSVYNDSTSVLYLKLGATASSSSFTVKMVADSYYEVPGAYTGVVDGIWVSATGNARVTEVT